MQVISHVLKVIPRDMSSIDQAWESEFTKVCQDTIDLLVKGTAHTRMKVIGWKTIVKTSATSDIGCLTKSLKKKKMNNLTFRQFSVSKCGDAFVGGIVE